MRFLEAIGAAWCQFWHPAPMWPVNGEYRCPECLRVYPVRWEQPPRTEDVMPLAVAMLKHDDYKEGSRG